jgi:NAD(P)-dependent dehydrogenase (short-subunit alcohol dehydrogenase family)
MPDEKGTVVVTGASSGFGAAAVRAFAVSGDCVWGTMRDPAGRDAGRNTALGACSPRIADAAPGKRPARTVLGNTLGANPMNAFAPPRRDALLKAMQRDTALGGADA